jgi:Transcriptional regulators
MTSLSNGCCAGGISLSPEEIKSRVGSGPLPSRDAPILDEHREIAEAILARDPDRAREAMRRHLVTGIKRYRSLTSWSLNKKNDDIG